MQFLRRINFGQMPGVYYCNTAKSDQIKEPIARVPNTLIALIFPPSRIYIKFQLLSNCSICGIHNNNDDEGWCNHNVMHGVYRIQGLTQSHRFKINIQSSDMHYFMWAPVNILVVMCQNNNNYHKSLRLLAGTL